MLELLVALGFILWSGRGIIGEIADIISLSDFAKGLISKIEEKDAFEILEKALDKTIREEEDAEAKNILNGLKKNKDLLRELHKRLGVSEEAKKEFVSHFKGREDIFEKLAKNYYD